MSRLDFPVIPDPNSSDHPHDPPSTERGSSPAPTRVSSLVAGRPAVDGEAAEQDAIGTSGAAPPGRVRDVVVVGGGIGGLVVASLLASAGRAVSLVEASDALGGDCRGLVQDGHRYDLGVSLLSGTGAGGVVGVLCDRLGLNLPVVACDPALQVALPRHRLDLPSGADGWWSEIRREFPEEEEVWHALVADLGALARDRDELVRHLSSWPPGGWLERFRYWRTLARRTWAGGTRQGSRQLRTAAGTPFQKTLTEYGFGAAGRQVLEACLWYALARGVDECSTLEAAVALQRLRDGVESPAGGPGALAELLAQRLRERGGDIRLQTGVARFLTERGRMIGVTTAAGETILARSVVTALAPGLGAGDVAYVTRGWMGWRGSIREPWHPHRVAELLGVTIPEAVVPSALGRHCLVVGDAGQPARDENLVFVRRTSGGRGAESRDGMARLTVGRFVPSTGSNDRRTAPQALWEALDRVIPGVARDVTHQVYLPPSAVGALWGRGAAAVRYTVETSGWLGRRGLRHETGWPNLHMVGPWTYPGRSVADVVEGAMHVADKLIGSARDGAR